MSAHRHLITLVRLYTVQNEYNKGLVQLPPTCGPYCVSSTAGTRNTAKQEGVTSSEDYIVVQKMKILTLYTGMWKLKI